MQKPDLDPSRSAEALTADIESYITEAARRLTEGELVGLNDLDTYVDALCKRVMALRADEAQHFIPRLEQLRVHLDALQEGMVAAKQKIGDEINATTQRQKAARAYRTPEDKK